MKRLFLFSLFFMFCLPFVYGAEVEEVYVGANWDVQFTEPYPATANDFHVNMDVESNGIPSLHDHWQYDHIGPEQGGSNWEMSGIDIKKDMTSPTTWHISIDFQISDGGFVFNGATVHFGAEFKVGDLNSLRVRMAYWTKDGEYLCPATLMGFRAWESSVGTTARIFNDSQMPMAVDCLEFAVTSFHVPLRDMFITGEGLPGQPGIYPQVNWVPINHPIIIEPGKSYEINLHELNVQLTPEMPFLQFRGYVNGIPQWFQHEL